tara:strand:+ start:996 stop:1913 length:918 start_codon:yes stop_codon:yes gene_type:complete
MLDEEKTIDVGEANEQETTIDLDAPAAQESVKEEIHVEEIPADEKPSEAKTDKEELGEYSDGVNKRIAKLTRKMREAERQKEEAITYAKNVTEDANKLRTRFNNLDNNFAKEFEQRVTGSTEAAKQRLAASIAAGDVEAQVEAQSEIATLAMENTRVKRIKQEQEYRANAPAPVQMPQQSTPQPARPDPQADAWASKNSWFGSDNAMTYTAFDIHKKLVEDEGFDPNTTDYYSEVDRRIRLEFPHKFDSVERSTDAPVQNVASAKRPATKGRRKTVRLTPSQVAISKRLGVPLEEYAKQLAAKEV